MTEALLLWDTLAAYGLWADGLAALQGVLARRLFAAAALPLADHDARRAPAAIALFRLLATGWVREAPAAANARLTRGGARGGGVPGPR